MAEITDMAAHSVLENIAVWEQNEVSLEKTNMSDSFFVDIENLSPNTIKDNKHSASSIISVQLQRNLSKKRSPRAERSEIQVASSGLPDGSSNVKATDRGCDHDKSTLPAPMVSLGMKETLDRPPQQTIMITAENRSSSGKYLKRRTSIIDPKRVLFFFASLSSMGTMLLIYYTLYSSSEAQQ